MLGSLTRASAQHKWHLWSIGRFADSLRLSQPTRRPLVWGGRGLL